MRYTGIQPQYFPRLHYFARLLNTDVFMLRDDVQYVRRHKYPGGRVDKSYQAHTPINSDAGIKLLSMPIKHPEFLPINKTLISYEHDWVQKHLGTLRFYYEKAANFDKLFPEIGEILKTKHKYLAQLNIATIFWAMLHLLGQEKVTQEMLTLSNINKKLGIQKIFRLKHIRLASLSPRLNKSPKLSANEKILVLCQETGADEDYCGGTAMSAYVDADLFKRNGIKITVQDWKCQPYTQLYSQKHEFIPNLSIIDLLINEPRDRAIKILSS